MKKSTVKKMTLLLLFSFCWMILLNGCGSGEKNSSRNQSVSEEDEKEADNSGEKAASETEETLGEFSVKDIEGNTYTQEMFADYDLTMVNVFTTWCSPCVSEIPDLEKLHNEMEDQGVNVVGIVLDAVDAFGKADEEVVETAKLLAEKTGAAYPFLIPDEGYLNGRLLGINAVPETFFVDKEGNITGETYSGSRSLEDWKTIVETELKGAVK